MKSNSYTKIGLICCLLFLPISSQARINRRAFKDIFSHFRPGMEHYSPALGQIAIESGFIENFRFVGNIKRGYEEEKGAVARRRDYKKDLGLDANSQLAIDLFPSNGGNLATTSDAKSNFGKYINAKITGILLNYAAVCHRQPTDNCMATKTLETDIWKAVELTKKDKATAKKSSKKTFKSIIENFKKAIEADKNGTSVYPAYTSELLLLAFFFEKFNNQKDIWDLLRALDDEITDKTSIPAENSPEDLLTEEDAANAEKKAADALSHDDIVTLNNASIFSTPYKPGVALLSNANAYAYDHSRNSQIKEKQFADCVEMAARHVMNLLLFNPDIKKFDLTHLDDKKIGDEEKGHPYKNFQAFYKYQTLDLTNAGDIETRSLWNEVVGDLNERGARGDICYRSGYSEHPTCGYELRSGYINFVNVFAKIFDIKLKALPEVWTLEEGKDLLKEWLSTIFKTINPKLSYEINLSQINQSQVEHMGEIDLELSGTISIIMRSVDNNQKLFSFDLYNQAGIHTKIWQLKTFDGVQSFINKIDEAIKTRHPQTYTEAMWLLTKDDLARKNHVFYHLFYGSLSDNDAKVTFLKKLLSTAETRLDLVNNETFSKILANILEDVSWNDFATLKKISPVIIELKKYHAFNKIIEEQVRGLYLHKNSDNINSFKNLNFLSCYGSSIENLALNNLAKLTVLDLINTKKLDTLSLVGLTNLKELKLNSSQIKNMSLNDLPELIVLNLEYTDQLKTLSLSSLGKLKQLFLYKSSIEIADEQLIEENPGLIIRR